METTTLYVLVDTTNGSQGATSYDAQLLRGRITDATSQAVIPMHRAGSLASIRRCVARQEAWEQEQREIDAAMAAEDASA